MHKLGSSASTNFVVLSVVAHQLAVDARANATVGCADRIIIPVVGSNDGDVGGGKGFALTTVEYFPHASG